ncbi:ASFV_G_ACD_00600 [African swine fever virus]|nr:pASFV_G_ACD_00600 [African swine fever virus]
MAGFMNSLRKCIGIINSQIEGFMRTYVLYVIRKIKPTTQPSIEDDHYKCL